MLGGHGYAILYYFSESYLYRISKKNYGVKVVFFGQKPFILSRTCIFFCLSVRYQIANGVRKHEYT
jgi:hypothetical protein